MVRHGFHVRRSGFSTAINAGHSHPGPGDHEPFAPISLGSTLPPSPPRPYPNHVLAKKYRREHHHDYDQHVGAEPGVNPRSGASIAEYSHFKQACVIDVVDYDADDATFRRVSNAGLIELLEDEKEHTTEESDSATLLPPRMVRWINITGIDWSVLSAVALKYSVSLPRHQFLISFRL
jgi:hypothetical protein